VNPLFAISRAVLLRMSRAAALGTLVQRTGWGRRAVQRFVAGNTIDEAVAVALEAKRRGFTVTLDRLGEASTGAAADVSVKLTAIGLSEGERVAAGRLEEILAVAQRVNGFVRVDAEHGESLDALHRIVLAARAAGRPVGTVIQANMRRASADVAHLTAAGVPIRLVKGAYDPGADGIGDPAAVDAAYLALAAQLMATTVPLAFGTHDDRLLDQLAERGRGRAEAQLLYGVRSDLAERLISAGWRVRIYTPYGPDWWPYSLRRMAERPANLRFVVRSLFGR
jgi:proline dehydrogenase